jgi:hypothetical protein
VSKSGTLGRSSKLAASVAFALAAVALSATQAHANSYGNMNMPQLQSLCESHGSRTWPLPPSGPNGTGPSYGTLVIPTEQVQQGSEGDCVAYAQILLGLNFGNDGINSPYQHLSVDGDFGPNTEAATLAIQKYWVSLGESWCGPADGVVGPRTWMCLEFATTG